MMYESYKTLARRLDKKLQEELDVRIPEDAVNISMFLAVADLVASVGVVKIELEKLNRRLDKITKR